MEHDLATAMAGLVRGVTRVRVIDAGVSKGQALAGPLLCELTGDDAAGLLERLAVVQPDRQFHCMCLGHPALELWAGDRLRATIGVHHGLSVRVHGWWSDAPLQDGEGLLRWLADRGVGGPLETWMQEQAAAGEAERQRMAWLAATPAALRSRIAELEGHMSRPRHLKSTDADVVAAVAAVRAALGEGAAVALLGWFGGPGGPWNGYPVYENVACVLLQCLSLEELIAAGQGGDEGVLLGLGRFLARHGAAPRERKLVDAELRARLVGLVARRGDEDMQARLANALQMVEPRTRDGVRVGDAELAMLGPPVVCAGGTAALDGASVVWFEPGRTDGTMVVSLPDGVMADLGAASEDLVISLSQTGEVWRVPARGGEVRVVARGQARPTSPIGFAGRAAWLEQAEVSGHRTATRVRMEGEAEALYEHSGNAWDLIACDGALWWARHGGSLWSTLFGKNIHRVDLMRRDVSGRVDIIKVLEGGEDGVSFPRLFTDGGRIAWTSGQKIGVLDGAREVRWFAVDAEILAVHPLEMGVLVAVARQHVGELLRIDAGGQRVLARWRRALWERERLVVCEGRVVWNSGEHLWAVDLA